MSGVILVNSHILTFLIRITILQGRFYYPSYADEKAKAMWFRVTQLASGRATLATFNLGSPDSKITNARWVAGRLGEEVVRERGRRGIAFVRERDRGSNT